MNPKDTVLQSHKKEKRAQELLIKAASDWQKQQLSNAMERLFNFLETIENRRLIIMQHFDNDNKAFDMRLSVTVTLNPQKGCIDVCLSSGIVIGNNCPVQPLNLFWDMEKIVNELCKLKPSNLYSSKVEIPIFDGILLEMTGEICDYIKVKSFNYNDLNFAFRRDYTYITGKGSLLNNKQALYENGINLYTKLVL